MEGAAFMHVCVSAGKECLVIRALSDLAGGQADFVNVVQVFLAFSSANTAAVTRAILTKLPKT
jgi:nucleoside phosphorylase